MAKKRKFRVRHVGTSTPMEEIAYGESFEQLQQIYAMTDDNVELIEELPYEEPVVEPKKTVHVADVLMDNMVADQKIAPIPDDVLDSMIDNTKVKYFEVGGQKLMMKGDVLFEKVWTDVTDMSEYRIMSTKTDKLVTNENKQIQVLDWRPVEDSTDDTDNGTQVEEVEQD
jgi:hypothetical protein